MAAKLTWLTHKIAKQLQLVSESCSIGSSQSRRPVRKLLDTPSYAVITQKAMTRIFIAAEISSLAISLVVTYIKCI